MEIDKHKLEAAGVSQELLDAIREIPNEVEHNVIAFSVRLKNETYGLPTELARKFNATLSSDFCNEPPT